MIREDFQRLQNVPEALRQLLSLGNDAFMQRHHLYHCSLARVYTDQHQAAKALEHYRTALTCQPSLQESALSAERPMRSYNPYNSCTDSIIGLFFPPF